MNITYCSPVCIHLSNAKVTPNYLPLSFPNSDVSIARHDIVRKRAKRGNIPLSVYKNPAELPACPARICTRRLVATNEIHETDIRIVPAGHSAGLAVQTFRRANKRVNSGKRARCAGRRWRPPGRKEEKFEHLDGKRSDARLKKRDG